MTCRCDERTFPPTLSISAGLVHIPRQVATFPEWRNELLSFIGQKTPLADWRARGLDDFGVMLLEMWAYVCDSLSFYDEVIAHEAYLRTARLRSSRRKLVELLGYIPRPAVAATVSLALLADGRKSLTLPATTAFRSGAFGTNPPQIFEIDQPMTVHPLLNRWDVLPVRPQTIGDSGIASVSHIESFLCRPRTMRGKQGDWLLVKTATTGLVRKVTAVENRQGLDGTLYAEIKINSAVTLSAIEPLSNISLLVPFATGSLWKMPDAPLGNPPVINGQQIVLDGLYRQIRSGDDILLSKGSDVRWFRVTSVTESMRTIVGGLTSQLKDASNAVIGSIISPPITVPVTTLTLHAAPGWPVSDAANITLHYGMVRAGTVVRDIRSTLLKGDELRIKAPSENPGVAATSYLLEDKNNDGLAATGTLDFSTGQFGPDSSVLWNNPLMVPVQLYGNVVSATRGETVASEVLGIGNASIQTQRFKLKKNPLTYLPSPTDGNDQGVKNTLGVYVNGVQWQEVRSFYGVKSDATVYIVRQDDNGESSVIFGGGARLPTGAVVLATYRYGAGAASPPTGSVHQLAKPIPRLKSVRNPIAAFGGADAESSEQLAKWAPRSALLLGRAVSLPDIEAAAATVGGVRAVSAEWRWNKDFQRPVIQLFYVGEVGLAAKVRQRLHGLMDPTVPIAVDLAQAVTKTLSIQIDVDARYLVEDVVKAVRAALWDAESGLLLPERAGIGKALFRSRIFELVLSVPGANAVTGLLLDGVPFTGYGVSPGSGKYFDFKTGGVSLNGVVSHD